MMLMMLLLELGCNVNSKGLESVNSTEILISLDQVISLKLNSESDLTWQRLFYLQTNLTSLLHSSRHLKKESTSNGESSVIKQMKYLPRRDLRRHLIWFSMMLESTQFMAEQTPTSYKGTYLKKLYTDSSSCLPDKDLMPRVSSRTSIDTSTLRYHQSNSDKFLLTLVLRCLMKNQNLLSRLMVTNKMTLNISTSLMMPTQIKIVSQSLLLNKHIWA